MLLALLGCSFFILVVIIIIIFLSGPFSPGQFSVIFGQWKQRNTTMLDQIDGGSNWWEDKTDGGPNWCWLDFCATASSTRLIIVFVSIHYAFMLSPSLDHDLSLEKLEFHADHITNVVKSHVRKHVRIEVWFPVMHLGFLPVWAFSPVLIAFMCNG